MKIEPISHLDFETLMKVLSSTQITDSQKTQFVLKNKPQIDKIMEIKISSMDFNALMQKRAIQKFRPLKNSFTKKGDKIILAKALGINPSQVSDYIKDVKDSIIGANQINFLSPEKMDMIKSYIYRHGSKDELVAFLDYELTQTDDTLKTLYRTLRYYSGGVADYFIRPIHRMDNNTLIRVYRIITKHIEEQASCGKLSEAESERTAKWALIRIYQIQNNSKLINAIKTYKTLK